MALKGDGRNLPCLFDQACDVATAGGCTSPSFSAASTPELLVLNCSVKTVGDMPLAITDSMANQSTGTVNGFADVPTQDIGITSAVQTR